ncbi:hypothetical protein FQZ97_1058090 [compost metagenome]
MFGGHRDQVFALAAVEVRRALDGEVVGLGGARGPDDFARVGVDQRAHLLARQLHRLVGGPAKGMGAAGRVAVELGEVRNHLAGHAPVHRRGGRVVEVHGRHRAGGGVFAAAGRHGRLLKQSGGRSPFCNFGAMRQWPPEQRF